MNDFRLTARLAEVLRLVAGENMGYDEVAEELGVSYRTVVSHVTRIRDRSGLDLPPKAALYHIHRHQTGAD